MLLPYNEWDIKIKLYLKVSWPDLIVSHASFRKMSTVVKFKWHKKKTHSNACVLMCFGSHIGVDGGKHDYNREKPIKHWCILN